MAGAQKSIVVEVSPQDFFRVIANYEDYPNILPEMKAVSIHSRDGGVVEASFTVDLIKRVSYTLRLVEQAPDILAWSLVSGPFKTNTGSWRLESLGEKRTRAHYNVEVTVGIFVPKSIVNRLVGQSLPALLNAFKARAENLYA